MFGMSFGKVAVLVAIIAIVWFGFRWFQRWEKERRAAASEAPGRLKRDRESPPASARPGEAEVMTACRVCGAYVAPGARSCGHANCPFGRG